MLPVSRIQPQVNFPRAWCPQLHHLRDVQSTSLNLKNQQVLFGINAALPNRVRSSQSLYVVTGTRLIVVVPASITNLAHSFGARTYAGMPPRSLSTRRAPALSNFDAAAAAPIIIPFASVVPGHRWFLRSQRPQPWQDHQSLILQWRYQR
ncbi:hypothetical protein CF319_g8845 [Tilletia indica]|uniref:Uncharacterized protein n=1 Tax=Tilletia indica TaxID=43049 RepID=A0A8T8SC74_9BASI|nr:hypothetical protein CF319_g8845 [Tilletia indica]KAE8237011.1 hypothetical protein A4X13_0g8952 [Tilletia indica]